MSTSNYSLIKKSFNIIGLLVIGITINKDRRGIFRVRLIKGILYIRQGFQLGYYKNIIDPLVFR